MNLAHHPRLRLHAAPLFVGVLTALASACQPIEYACTPSSDDDCRAAEVSNNDEGEPRAPEPRAPEPRAPEPDAPEPEPSSPFFFVLIEDRSGVSAGDYPGADIDAVGLIKTRAQVEVFASEVEDKDIDCDGNRACDVLAMLGPPNAIDDGVCFGGGDVERWLFTSLGANGAVVVSFADVPIENGDLLHVYEIGSVECGRFDDDPTGVSVGISSDLDGVFIEIGETGAVEGNILPVSGL